MMCSPCGASMRKTVTGHGIDSGHFLPEEAPEETYRALHSFFAGKAG